MAVTRRSFLARSGTAALAGFDAVAAMAALADAGPAYPNRPIKLIVALSAGGPSDLLARIVAEPLAQRLGQAVIVDNRPGAGGNIGALAAARSPADGYTLLLGTSGPLSINASVYRSMPFDAVRDFAPITSLAAAPFIIVTNPTLPAHTLVELVALARKQPGRLNEGSVSGSAAHLASELFKSMAGIDITHIPYKGAAPATNDLIAGQIDISFASAPGVAQLIRARQLRALAATGVQRLPGYADLPTVAECGFPGYEADVWYGLVAPAGTPADIVDRLNAEMSAILKDPIVRKQMVDNDLGPRGSSPQDFGAFIRSETLRWNRVVKARGIKAV